MLYCVTYIQLFANPLNSLDSPSIQFDSYAPFQYRFPIVIHQLDFYRNNPTPVFSTSCNIASTPDTLRNFATLVKDKMYVAATQTPPTSPATPTSPTRPRLRPITRLLPRNRNNTSSTPISVLCGGASTTAPAQASTSSMATTTVVALPPKDVRGRMCASLPTRRLTANSRSSSPSPGSRLHRRARRFPKPLIEFRDSQQNTHPAVPFDALDQFFGPFAPSRSTLADFYNSFCDVDQLPVENDEGEEGDDEDDEDDGDVGDNGDDGDEHENEEGDGNKQKQNPALSSSSATYSNSRLDTSADQPGLLPNENEDPPTSPIPQNVPAINCEVRSSCNDSQDSTLGEVRGEMAMLCRLVQSELREARNVQEMRYSSLQDTVNEAVRLAESLEGRLDAMRIPQRRQDPRPSVLLALTVMDAIASVILFVISFCIARPIIFARHFAARARGMRKGNADRPVSEKLQRISRSWRLSNRELEESFLVDTVSKRISFSTATRLE